MSGSASLLMLALLGALACIRVSAGEIQYKGYVSEIDDQSLDAVTLQNLHGQIDIVEGVGLPGPITDFFKQHSIVVDTLIRQPGEYVRGRLLLNPVLVDDSHPVLLHEYLHALHYERIGLSNANIRRAYLYAVDSHLYPDYANAHFLQNEMEYFAVLGTIYLFRTIHQPPYNCSVLKRTDPGFIDFLKSELGEHAGCG